MLEVLEDKGGSAKTWAFDDVVYSDDVGVFERTGDMVLPFDFGGFDGEEDFDGNFLFGLGVSSFEDM